MESGSLTYVKGVGEVVAKKLKVLGIETAEQLIENYPRRYDDFSELISIKDLHPGPVTIRAKISQAKGRYARRGLHITEAVASDETDSVRLVWFNQPYRAAAIREDAEYFISGEFGLNYRRFSIMNPSAELVSDFPVNTARIIPIYRETKGLKSTQIRKILRELVPQIRSIPESLPAWMVDGLNLPARAQAVEQIHFPDSSQHLAAARKRLGFEEVFELSLAALLNKHEIMQEHSVAIPFDEKLAKDFVGHLPFQLTGAQRKVIWQVYQDMEKTQPMNRLVEGDVGAGKTVVAAMAAVMVMKQDRQVAFMAPTELLARQHAETLHKLLLPLGMAESLSLLIGSVKPKQKQDLQARIKRGETQLIVGTHALISENVDMHKLGLVIIDEQHRFGVEERKKLLAKAGHAPHVLSLTATPIPRSLALTLYGELDISVIDQKPADRKTIKTKIFSPNARAQLYEKVDQELAAGRQAFVVAPLITESDITPAKSAEEIYEEMSKKHFKHRRVGLLHGKMKPADKEVIMQRFIDQELDILVATTVIEVGVDVPNASVMVIEGADRFGLAQVHQLRGRVGRGADQGYCYLVTSDSNPPSPRLRALETLNDGFRLAELDLEFRGPGAIYGTSQHGQLDLRIAKLTDTKLIAAARRSAQEFIDRGENLLKYKQLAARVKRLRAVTNLN